MSCNRLASCVHLTRIMAILKLPTLVAANSLAVLTPLWSSVRDIRAQLPGGRDTPHRLARQLDVQAAALGARVDLLANATQGGPRTSLARPAPVPADPAGLGATLSWLANLLRRSVDVITLDPMSKAVVVRALGQIELASFDAAPHLA